MECKKTKEREKKTGNPFSYDLFIYYFETIFIVSPNRREEEEEEKIIIIVL